MPVRPNSIKNSCSHFAALLGLSGLAAMASAAEGGAAPDFNFKGDVQIQGDKSWAKGWGGNNLDNLWGRINFGADYKNEDFSSKFNIRIFPEGFGFEPVVGATYDTSGQGAIKVKTSEQARVLINHAWVKQQFPDFAIRVGRFQTQYTPSFIYGEYIDLPVNGAFGSRNSVHNATEITAEVGGLTSSLLLGTSDRNLNRGFLRIYETWESGQGLTLSAGLRSNIFDKVYDIDSEILNRITGSAHYSPDKKWGFYLEAAMLQLADVDNQYPVLLGAYIPAAFLADRLSLEAEIVPDRTLNGEDRPVLLALYAQKKVFKRATFDVGVYSDTKGDEFIDMTTAARFTCSLK